MPRKTQYRKIWEDEVDTSGEKLGTWVSEIIGDKDKARCWPCKKDLSVTTHGINALQSHAQTLGHKKKVESANAYSRSIPSTSTGIQSTEVVSKVEDNSTIDEQTLNAEAIWSAMVAEHDVSFRMSDHVSKNLQNMFPDSSIAAGFKCCRTKTRYMICEGISCDLQEKLVQSIQNVPYSIMIDESNKQYGNKFLCVMIKFYDEAIEDVTTRFLDICICNKGTADIITQHVVEIINRNYLSFDSLIQVMSDSPNVMRGVHTGVVTQISSKFASHIIDIGGCSLHHVSNSIKNSLPELHKMNELEDFLQDISAFFSFHIEFCDKYTTIQNIFNLENHRILSYSEVRFLSIYPVVERLIEQYSVLKKLFLEEIPNKYRTVAKQPRVIRICSALKDKVMLPTLYFIRHALEIFQKYEKLFQRSEPTIHLLYNKQIDLYRTTLLHFCHLKEIEKLKSSDTLLSFDFKEPDNILPYNELSIGSKAKSLISRFPVYDKTVFHSGIKRFYIKVCEQLKKNLSLKNTFLADLRFLHPEYRVIKGEKMILQCASSMPPNFKLTSRDMDALSIEWKQLIIQDVPNVSKLKDHIPLNEYWKTIFEMRDLGEPRFPIITKVVKFALSIAEANGDVERLFSQVKHVITKERNKLDIDSVRGLLVVRSFLQTHGSCLNFSIDESMKTHIMSARSKYGQRNSEKNKNESIHKRVLEDANKSFKENKKLKELENKKVKIEKQEEEIKLKQSTIKMLLEQATSLMEDSDKMTKFLCTEKTKLEKAEKEVQQSIIKSTCKKVVKKKYENILPSVDMNNNETESDSN